MKKILIWNYQTGACIGYTTEKTPDGNWYTINWDGYKFDNEEEYKKQIEKWLQPLKNAGFNEEKLRETKEIIEIATNYLRP